MSPGGRPKVIAPHCAYPECSKPGRSRFKPKKGQLSAPAYCTTHHKAMQRRGAFECSWDGCRNLRQWNKLATHRKGFCRVHERPYLFSYPGRIEKVLEKSVASIDVVRGCWVWRLSDREIADGERPRIFFGFEWTAYRLLYVLLVGPLAPKMTLDHLCGDRACVAPHHMEEVSLPENKRRNTERKKRKRSRARDVEANIEEMSAGDNADLLAFFMRLRGSAPTVEAARVQMLFYRPRTIYPRNAVVQRGMYHERDR